MCPTVSVVIPAYNAERFLDGTLASARSQSYRDLEIIVVDDGSTDRTPEIIHRHANEDPRIRIIRTENRGVAEARNSGTLAAHGRYVAYLDADDLWHPEKIERQVQRLDSRAADPSWGAVYVKQRMIGTDDRPVGRSNQIVASGYILSRHLVFKFIGNGSSIMVRRDVALAVGGFDPSYAAEGAGGAEDLDFELKIAARWKIDAVDEYLVGYRVHGGNMSSDGPRMIAAMSRTIRRHLDRNPQLPGSVRRMALAKARRYSVLKLLATGHFGLAARAGLHLAGTDPIGLLALFASYARKLMLGARDRIDEEARRQIGTFLELPSDRTIPTTGLPIRRRDRRWMQKLSVIDEVLEARVIRKREDPET